jgi:DNA-binding response OmpR family regulator
MSEQFATGPIRSATLAPRRSTIILLVEDDDGLRSILKAMLNGEGYTVLMAKTGDEAFRLFLESGGSIDVMFVDIVLPGINGLDLVQLVQSQWARTKIVVSSGQLDPTRTPYGFYLGRSGTAFLKKPFSVDSLLHAITTLLRAGDASVDPGGLPSS